MPSPFYTTGPRGLIRSLLGTSNIDDVDAGFLAMATDVETKMVNYSSGLASARPAAGVEGRIYRATDSGAVSFDNGTVWLPVMIPQSWQALTFAGVGIYDASTPPDSLGTSPCGARVVGDTCQLRGALANANAGGANISAGVTLFTVPSTCYPSKIQAIQAGGTIGSLIDWTVSTAGAVSIGVTIPGPDVPPPLTGLSYSLT